MSRKIILLFIILLISGCASTSPRLAATLAPAANIGNSVDCQGGCKDEWERAQLWIARHSMWKIQTSTDVIIQTFNPIRQEVSYGFTVMKEPVGGGNYSIVMNLMCGNALGCSPKPIDVRNAFYYYVKHGKDLLVGQGYMGSIR
jgi:uncharacterized protein YceK